jgi:tetraacyldisaccharide 4'-kinase
MIRAEWLFERGGNPAVRLARAALGAASTAYGIAMRFRSAAYAVGLLRTARMNVPVISVGNLTCGGTGKTPMCELLAARLAPGFGPAAILSRGYGLATSGIDDETLPPDRLPPAALRLTGANRVALAHRAVRDFGARVLILDDGFQHLRIARDLDILLIDATDPFSNGRLLPRGLLREPVRAARRADLIVITRCDLAPPEAPASIRKRLEREGAGGVPVAEAIHEPVALRSLWTDREHEPSWLHGRRVFAFAGIGNPEAFRKTLLRLGANVARFRKFPDHHRYTEQELRVLDAEAQEFLAEDIVTTEKDARRLAGDVFRIAPWALQIRMTITSGAETFWRSVETAVSRALQAPARSTIQT